MHDSNPKVGIITGNDTRITLSYESDSDFLANRNLWCVFTGIGSTRLEVITQSRATCTVPASFYPGKVSV